MIRDSAILKLTRLCSSISSESGIISDLIKEIETQSSEKLVLSMIKTALRKANLEGIGVVNEILPLFFLEDTITEIDLYSNSDLGIKCFFMSKGTYFPLHDHANQVVITSVLYGEIKYLTLDKTENQGYMKFVHKGLGKPGKIMSNTQNYSNVHTIYAAENAVILDIFMHNPNEAGNFYKVHNKRNKLFEVSKMTHVFFKTRSWKMQNCDCTK